MFFFSLLNKRRACVIWQKFAKSDPPSSYFAIRSSSSKYYYQGQNFFPFFVSKRRISQSGSQIRRTYDRVLVMPKIRKRSRDKLRFMFFFLVGTSWKRRRFRHRDASFFDLISILFFLSLLLLLSPIRKSKKVDRC